MSCRPYPGLRPFRRDEDHLFFGREAQTDELLALLGDAHFIAVLGTSGSGKSSLVRAGLLPALEGGLLARAGARWQIAELRPGSAPVKALAHALIDQTAWGRGHAGPSADPSADPSSDQDADQGAEPGADPAAALETDLRKGPMALNWLLGLRPPAEGARLLIVADQFEELFRFADTAATAPSAAADTATVPARSPAVKTARQRDTEAFVALLLAAATHPSVYVVITMRSDFLGDCARHSGLPEAVNAGLYLTPRLDPEQMADAIRLPARLCGGEVDPGLVERLLDAARGEMDQLPLLQHALMRLRERRPTDGRLSLDAFQSLGGLPRALDEHAEEVYKALPRDQQALSETLFRSLTEGGSGQRDTRRPVTLGEVAELAQRPVEDIANLAEAFRAPGRDFLMPPPPDAPGGQALDGATKLDITHEALIRQWQRLQGWTRAEGDDADLYRRLEGDARRRQETGQASLWSGAELALARPWLADLDHTRSWALRYAAGEDAKTRAAGVELALGFLQDSAEAAERAETEREARRKKELRRARRTTLATLIVLALMSAIAGWGWIERGRADKARDRAQATEQKAVRDLYDSEITHAALLAHTEDYAKARERLDATRELDARVPPERRLARDLLAGYTGLIGGEAEYVYQGAGAPLASVAISPDGRWVAAGGERGTLVLWDAETGELVQRLEGHEPEAGGFGSVYGLAFHPKGDWLASAGEDKQIILWSLPGGDGKAEPLRQWEAPAAVASLAVRPDGALIASGGDDKAITLWDPQTAESVRTLDRHQAQIAVVSGLAFSPDGTRLASASYDNTARLWDTKTGAQQAILKAHQGQVLGVAFSADGRLVSTTGADARTILWGAEDGSPLRAFTGHRNYGMSVAVTDRPSEQDTAPLIASAGMDRTIRVWDSDGAVTQRLYQGHEAGILGIAIHGENLYSAANDGTVRRWSLDLPRQRLLDLPSEPASTAIAPDGGSVAVGLTDGSLRIYGLPDLDLRAEAPDAHDDRLQRLAWSPDGKFLASAGFDTLARLWRVGPEGKIEPLRDLTGHERAVHAVAFSPDGKRLATAGYDGRIGLFDTATGEGRFIQSTQGHTLSVAFDPSGTQVIATDNDNRKARTWDVTANPPTLVREIEAGAEQLLWAEPDAEGRRVAAAGRDLVVTILDAATGETLARLPGHEQVVYKARFLPGGRQVATASSDATVRLWDLDTRTQLFSLRLPADRHPPAPLWDFDLRCTPAQGEPPVGTQVGTQDAPATPAAGTEPIATGGHCWLAVPLTRGKLALYDLGQAPWPKP